MNKLTYAEAVKKVKTLKTKETYMVIRVDERLVLPHKDGMHLLQALQVAEALHAWDDDRPIHSVNRESIRMNVLSAEEYERHKLAALLGMTLKELKEAETVEEEPTTP